MTIEELDKLSDEATPLPWVWRVADGLCNKYVEENAIVIGRDERDKMTDANAQFIAGLANAYPYFREVFEAAKTLVNKKAIPGCEGCYHDAEIETLGQRLKEIGL